MKLKTSAGNADGALLSDQEYGQQRSELVREKQALEVLLDEQGEKRDEALHLAEQIFEFSSTVRDRFAKGDAKAKKEILMAIGSNLTLAGKKLSIEAKKPFRLIEGLLVGADSEFEPTEPENTGLSQRQEEAFASSCPRVLGDVDDVRTLHHRFAHTVKAIYAFFRSFAGSPWQIFPGWLTHENNLPPPDISKKAPQIADDGK